MPFGYETIETVYPKTAVQLYIVHPVRNSLDYVSWKMRKQVAAELKQICPPVTDNETKQNGRVRSGNDANLYRPDLAAQLEPDHLRHPSSNAEYEPSENQQKPGFVFQR